MRKSKYNTTKLNIKENSKFLPNKIENSNEENIEDDLNFIYDKDIEYSCKYEKFDDEETDPYKTNAKYSGLWELYTLKNHFSCKIRSLINKFEHNFLKSKEFDLNSMCNLKDEDLIYEMNESSNFYINYQFS
jgi:hypothetical protein